MASCYLWEILRWLLPACQLISLLRAGIAVLQAYLRRNKDQVRLMNLRMLIKWRLVWFNLNKIPEDFLFIKDKEKWVLQHLKSEQWKACTKLKMWTLFSQWLSYYEKWILLSMYVGTYMKVRTYNFQLFSNGIFAVGTFILVKVPFYL